MTIIDELLILLDDLGEVSAEELPNCFDKPNLQVIFSSLGRLVNRGWVIKKEKRTQGLSYAISLHGVNELNRTLDAIKKEEIPDWDQRWRLVIFDIPETKRKIRDTFRNFLKEEGFGLLKSSVWLSPWDKTEEIKRVAKRHNLNGNLTLLETSDTETYQSVVMAQQSWDWPTIEKHYRQFLNEAEKELPELKNAEANRRRFKAKKLVFRYAEVVKEDPVLPTEIAPNATLARRANELYARIRPYCLREEQ